MKSATAQDIISAVADFGKCALVIALPFVFAYSLLTATPPTARANIDAVRELRHAQTAEEQVEELIAMVEEYWAERKGKKGGAKW